MTRLLWVTNVGSHMWKMDTPESDIDLFYAFVDTPFDYLVNGPSPRSYNETIGNRDIVYHEIGKIVHMLLKGNVNFVWGVHSPLIDVGSPELMKLRSITEKPAANIYHSIHGLAIHNYKKYVMSGKNTSQKKLKTIYRTVRFGIDALEGKGYVFRPVEQDLTVEDVEDIIRELEIAYQNTSLPENPPWKTKVLKYLYDIRVKELQEELNGQDAPKVSKG